MIFDLEHLTDADVVALTERVSGIGAGASNRQAVAERIVELLYDCFRVPDSSEPACALVRCFQTSYYARLPMEYQHVGGCSAGTDAVAPEHALPFAAGHAGGAEAVERSSDVYRASMYSTAKR
jgi:hypothetical protein